MAETQVDFDGDGDVALSELECPVCFNSYEFFVRKPKLLACQHGFCAICLKVILEEKDGCWVVPCPLCRRYTLALDASVANLPDNPRVVDLLSRRTCPFPESVPEVLLVPHLLLPMADAGVGGEVPEVREELDFHVDQGEILLAGCAESATKRFLLTLIFFLIIVLAVQYFVNKASLVWVTVVLGSLSALITLTLLYSCCQKRGHRRLGASCNCNCPCLPATNN
eukprot:gi/632976998/ref/XP_007905104.1/ PREDICTED: RING finger protein 186 [Callorhinchus milii]